MFMAGDDRQRCRRLTGGRARGHVPNNAALCHRHKSCVLSADAKRRCVWPLHGQRHGILHSGNSGEFFTENVVCSSKRATQQNKTEQDRILCPNSLLQRHDVSTARSVTAHHLLLRHTSNRGVAPGLTALSTLAHPPSRLPPQTYAATQSDNSSLSGLTMKSRYTTRCPQSASMSGSAQMSRLARVRCLVRLR